MKCFHLMRTPGYFLLYTKSVSKSYDLLTDLVGEIWTELQNDSIDCVLAVCLDDAIVKVRSSCRDYISIKTLIKLMYVDNRTLYSITHLLDKGNPTPSTDSTCAPLSF